MDERTTRCYCLQVRRAAAKVAKFYDGVLAPCGITTRQCSLLLNISQAGQCSVRELAGMSQLDGSTTARNLKPLFKQGLVRDDSQPGARSSRLTLTEAGRTILAQAAGLWREAQRAFMKNLGESEVDALNKALAAIEALPVDD